MPPEMRRIYYIWAVAKDRCRNERSKDYPRYGGRGILFDARWDQFETFLADMGLRPSPKHSIDRRDNDGPYSPDNCQWATPKEQGRNQRSNTYVEIYGERRKLIDLIDQSGITYATVRSRLHYGWSAERALSAPVRPKPTHSPP